MVKHVSSTIIHSSENSKQSKTLWFEKQEAEEYQYMMKELWKINKQNMSNTAAQHVSLFVFTDIERTEEH